MKTTPLLALAASVVAACATPVARRSYERSDLDQLPIGRLDLVVVASAPEDAGAELDVEPFRTLVSESVLLEKPADAAESALLAAQVRAVVSQRGYVLGRVFTSTAGLDPSTRLDELVRTSTADAVLVVRAVPIDRFSVVDDAREFMTPNLGLGVIRNEKARELRGRLYLGQAFLFAAGSGRRLSSRQAPDYPDGGRLTSGHAFLENGLVLKEEVPALTDELRSLAAERFIARLLANLPTAKPGAPNELRNLAAASDDDGPLQAFLDEVHVGAELTFQHRLERLEAALVVGDQQVASLEAGDFAPSGVFQLLPRVTYWSPTGVIFGLGVPLGFATQDLRRTLLIDDAGGGDATIQRLEVDGLQLVGVVLDAGLLVPLSAVRPTLFLVPRGFFATEIWFLAGNGGAARTRSSVGAGVELLYRPADGPVFVRIGLEGRLGLDFAQGGLLSGFASTLGTGWLF